MFNDAQQSERERFNIKSKIKQKGTTFLSQLFKAKVTSQNDIEQEALKSIFSIRFEAKSD